MKDTTEQMRQEAKSARGHCTWRENGTRLIHCQWNPEGTFTFRNTTSATRHGPVISEAVASRYLADEGSWIGPRSIAGESAHE